MGSLLSRLQTQAGRGIELNASGVQFSESKWLRLWPWPSVVAIFLVVADQGTKEWVRAVIPKHDKVQVIPNFFDLVHVYNKGAAWGMLSEHTFILGLISAAVFSWLLWKFHDFTEGWPERGVAITLLLGGVVGNLIDRFFRSEGVVDFVSVYVRVDNTVHEWPAFNVADSAICIGVGLFVLSSFMRPPPPKIETPEKTDTDSEK